MTTITTIRLHRALPLLVIGSFTLLLSFSVFYLHQQMLDTIETNSVNDVRQLLANTELHIEALFRHGQQDLIAQEIAEFSVNTHINSITLVNDAGRIIQAMRLDWLGHAYQDVLPEFDLKQFYSTTNNLNSTLHFSADRQHILGYQPVITATESGQLRPTHINYILLDYDVARSKSASWELLIRSMYPILGVGLLLMLVISTIISLWIDRPLQHLTKVMTRFTSGDYAASAQLTGNGELAEFGEVWNQMRKQLTETIKQLEESKERLAVTLFSIGDAVIATDMNSCITFMNEIAVKLTGWSHLEAKGKPLKDVFIIVNANTRQPAENPVKRVLATGKIIGLANHTVLIARDGTEYQIADSAAPIRPDKDKIFGVVLVFRDVTEEYALRDALFNERALLRNLIDAVPDLIFYKDCNSVYLGCNKAFEQFTGRTEQEQIGKTDFDFFDQQTAATFQTKDNEMFECGVSSSNEEEVIYPDGHHVILDTIKTPFYAPDGKCFGLIGISRDITERKGFEKKLAESDDRIRSLGNNLPNGYIYQYALAADGTSSFQFISAGVEKVHGLTVEAVLNNALALLNQIDPAQIAHYKNAEERSARELSDFSMELRMHHPKGYDRWIQVCSRPKISDGLTVWDGVAIDITEKKLSDEQIWRQANFDPLTELPNRRMFHESLEHEIKIAHRKGAAFAMLFIDLDRFKEINDTLGHILGDKLLQIAAQRLCACVRDTDITARLGGDEFMVILADLDNLETVERIAQSILSNMSEPFPLNGKQSYISASIGITIYPSDASDAEQLTQNADQAMYAAKDRGRNCYSYFTVSMQEAAQHRLSMANDLRGALALQQFEVYYQPIVELQTGKINKAEALIRWHHPIKGLISPALFIPVAEEIGLIHEIGDWVFKEAAQQAKILRSTIDPRFQISINKSPIQFRRPDIMVFNWLSYLEQLKLAGDSVIIEITEGLLLDASNATFEILISYRDAGIQVSLDDFGTGYSSLSYIKKFDIDYLKIDQSFVRNLPTNITDMALCEAMILMAHKLSMKVIAEGIETPEQRDFLMQAGCDYGQGYLFSKPVPVADFEALIKLVVSQA
jgi:diguanylate cyclase (GGDEF)-like protein/PAS domain S-box-containing protein